MSSIFLRWRGKTFSVDHPDIIGFTVYETETLLPGETCLGLGLMRRDGSSVPLHQWHLYDVNIDAVSR